MIVSLVSGNLEFSVKLVLLRLEEGRFVQVSFNLSRNFVLLHAVFKIINDSNV